MKTQWHWHKSRTLQHLHDESCNCFAGVSMPVPTNKQYHANKENMGKFADLIAAVPVMYEALSCRPETRLRRNPMSTIQKA